MPTPNARVNRPVLYEIECGSQSLFFRSADTAIGIYKEWVSHAINTKDTCDITLYALLSPTPSRVYSVTQLAMLLNGGWEMAKMQHYSINDGTVVNVFIGKRAHRYEYGKYKYRKSRRMNHDLGNAFSLFCQDKNLVELAIRSPNFGVFVGALSLENQTEEIKTIRRHARQIYNMCHKRGAYCESRRR
jgi:hypothetical protein